MRKSPRERSCCEWEEGKLSVFVKGGRIDEHGGIRRCCLRGGVSDLERGLSYCSYKDDREVRGYWVTSRLSNVAHDEAIRGWIAGQSYYYLYSFYYSSPPIRVCVV